MDNPEKLATLDTQDTRLKTNKTKRDEQHLFNRLRADKIS